MKINIILKKSHYSKFPKRSSDIVKNFSNKNNIFFNEYLNLNNIEELNDCDLIYARHDLSKKVIDEINVPILIVNERLSLSRYLEPKSYNYIWSMNHLFNKKNVFFLTDKIFENKSKKIYSYSFILNNFKNSKVHSKYKNIDVLYLSRHNYFSKDSLIKKFVNSNINNYENFVESSRYFYLKNYNILKRLFGKLINKSTYSFSYFYEEAFLSLRYLRKQNILKQLKKINEKKYSILYHGVNNNDLHKIDCNGILEFENFDETFKRSKIVVVATPCHHSFINERIMLALENSTIPLVEKYPQYKELGFPNEFYFDYSDNSLEKCINNILQNYPKYYLLLEDFKKKIDIDKYSIKNFFKKIINMSKKSKY